MFICEVEGGGEDGEFCSLSWFGFSVFEGIDRLEKSCVVGIIREEFVIYIFRKGACG